MVRSIQWRLFLAAWLAYAFFHQGGGWNQNARFAMTRAIVEQARFAIDSYLLYLGTEPSESGPILRRTEIVDGGFRHRGLDYVMAWPDGTPVRAAVGNERPAQADRLASTGDLAYAGGSFFPNKAPGTSLIGVPAYFALFHLEGWLGLSPDVWWTLTVNAWLTTAFGLGLLSALGVVVFFRVARFTWPAGPAWPSRWERCFFHSPPWGSSTTWRRRVC